MLRDIRREGAGGNVYLADLGEYPAPNTGGPAVRQRYVCKRQRLIRLEAGTVVPVELNSAAGSKISIWIRWVRFRSFPEAQGDTNDGDIDSGKRKCWVERIVNVENSIDAVSVRTEGVGGRDRAGLNNRSAGTSDGRVVVSEIYIACVSLKPPRVNSLSNGPRVSV